jgi:hypothetical protein
VTVSLDPAGEVRRRISEDSVTDRRARENPPHPARLSLSQGKAAVFGVAGSESGLKRVAIFSGSLAAL